MQRVLTVCPHCSAGCGLYLLTDRGAVIGVMPSAGHPVSHGSLCMRGWTSFQHLQRPERLASPSIRRNGALRNASWEEALSYLLDRLGAIREKEGGEAVGFWASGRATNEELFLLGRIALQGLTSLAVGFDPTPHPWGEVPPSLLRGSRAAGFEDIPTADLLLVLNENLEAHHPQAAARILKAFDRGAQGVVFSPRQDLLASRGTRHVPTPFPEEAARGLADWRGEVGESLRGMWEEAGRPLVVYALKSLPADRERILLAALERLMDGPRGKVLLLFPRANSRGALHRQPEPAFVDLSALKALLVVEENPAGWNGATREMLQGLELLAVLDCLRTETTEVAHVVLPTAGFAEKAGTLTSTEGRQQEMHPAVHPPGEARPGWDILADLARRLGLAGVGLTLEEIRRGVPAEQVEDPARERRAERYERAEGRPPGLRHVPDRLGWMWLQDTILRHTDDWQREHQDRWVAIHPEDAKALGLRPGWMVRVSGDGAEFQAMTRISERAARGVLVTPHHLFEGPVQVERAA